MATNAGSMPGVRRGFLRRSGGGGNAAGSVGPQFADSPDILTYRPPLVASTFGHAEDRTDVASFLVALGERVDGEPEILLDEMINPGAIIRRRLGGGLGHKIAEQEKVEHRPS